MRIGDTGGDPEARWYHKMSDSQILRMRLTIVSGASRWAAGEDVKATTGNAKTAGNGLVPLALHSLGDIPAAVARGVA